MKKLLILVSLLYLVCPLAAQKADSPGSSSIYLKFDPVEIAFAFPRVGIGIEKKLLKHSLWASFHYGWEELNFGNDLNYYSEPFNFWGIKTGVKRRYPDGIGEYFIGSHLAFDHTSSEVFEDVYYDLKNDDAILFDKGLFQRDRIRLFFEQGYEFFSGDRFTLEMSGGLGVSRIEISYKDVENPFLLNDVEPRHYHRKSQHKYAGIKWRFAFTGAIKFGVRL